MFAIAGVVSPPGPVPATNIVIIPSKSDAENIKDGQVSSLTIHVRNYQHAKVVASVTKHQGVVRHFDLRAKFAVPLKTMLCQVVLSEP